MTLTSISINGSDVSGVNANTFHRTTGWPSTSDNSRFLQFTITLTDGYTFANQPISVSFGAQVSSTSTAARDYTITYGYGSSPTFSDATNGTVTGTTTSTTTTTNISIPAPGNTTTTILIVRILIYGSTSGTGNFRITALSLTGYEPNAPTPSITLNNNTQITTGNVNQGETNHILSRFKVNVATANATLNQLSFNAGGTFVAGDVTNFKLYTSTSNSFPGGSALSTVSAVSIANGGTVSFSSLSQACNVGDRYFWITADISGSANAGNTLSVPSLSASNFTFASGTPTGTIDAGGAQTIIEAVPEITLSSPSPSASDITQGQSNQVIYRFDLAISTANATLNGVTITTAGTYAAADLTNIKCWYSSDNSFDSGTDELLSTKTTSLGAGAQIFPSFTSKTITSGTTGYIFITVDLPVSATEGNTISVDAITTSDISFVSGNKSGTASASGTKTIIACTPTNVTSLSLTPGNTQIAVSWSNPSCFDEIMIVAKPGSSISASPSGDGSAYTANLSFGSGTAFDGTGYVVYKGSTSPQTITGLTNGTTYYVKVFTRRGTVWSDGAESSSSPVYSSSTSDYFRSKATGNWNAVGTWESSPNGSDWYNATLTPTSSANTITIRNGHNVTITESVTIDQVSIESGGTLTHTGGTITVDNGTGDDMQVNDGGAFVLSLASTAPSFNLGATCLISTGGILRVTTTGLTGAGAGVNLANFVYQNASILEYTSSSTFSASGVTFFPNADASTIPVFRVTLLTASPGGSSNTVINGVLEANSSFTWAGSGTKTFRNGIRGTGKLTQGTNGQWIISGTTAELSGTGELELGTNGLVINSGTTVTSNSMKTISEGTVTNNGTLTISSEGALVLAGYTNSATGTTNLNGTLTVSGTLSNSGTLTIKSDASGTGSLIHSSSGVSATVERYVAGHGNAAAEGWHLMGSPVATFNITGSSFQPGTNDDLYAWSESTNTWLNYKAGNPTQIVPGTGYLLAYENTGTKSFSGSLNVSNVSVSGLAHNASQGKGWHLLGNPFASALEWNKTGGSWALTNIAGTAKIWNSTSKTYTDITANGIIPSAQGFFVQVAESTTGSLTIPSAARAHSATGWYKNTTPRILLSASPADGSSRQESQIRLEPEATSGFDFYWDSRFLEGYAPKFYSIMGNEKLSTNAMPVLPNGTSIPFGFEKNQHSSYVIRLEESLPGETLFLKDLKLNTVHNLSQNPEYLFSAVQGDDPNRFLLVFGTVGVDEKPAAQAQLQAYMANGLLWVNNPAEKSQLAVFDLSGRLLMQRQLRSKGLQQLSLNLQKGAYILRLTEGNSSLSTKVINQ
ncbi:MAG: T9SS type A sorting domain-containing protein [Bacteroidia bacterium]|nr:T9SS type A sorting domain-containing protein [Bacteroidia bacterium]